MPLISPAALDLLVMVAQLVMGFLAYGMLLDRATAIARWKSGLTASMLWLLAFGFWAGGPAWLSTASSAFCALAWTGIAVWRSARPPLLLRDVSSKRPFPPPAGMVERHRLRFGYEVTPLKGEGWRDLVRRLQYELAINDCQCPRKALP